MALTRFRPALAAAALLAAVPSAPAPAQEGGVPAAEAASPAACPRPSRPVLRVAVSDPDPVLSTDAGIDALHAMTGRPRSPAARHLGLTTSRIEWQSEVRLRAARLPAPAGNEGSPMYCVVPVEVTLTLAQAEHRIRIAAELPIGGCLFAEVEAHERRHAAVNRETLRRAAQDARTAAAAWLRSAEARGATPEAAAHALRLSLRQAIEPAMARMRETQARRHAAIDTPAEYRRLARVCPEDQALLAERLRGG